MMKTTAPFFGPILAGALALGSVTATPAQAGNDDVAKVLLGLTALTVLGAALADGGSAKAAPAHRAPPPPPVTKHRHPPQQHRVKRLPDQCRLQVILDGKKRTVYGKSCTEKYTRHSASLPRSCERNIHVFGRKQDVYFQGCLREKGWRS